MLCLLAAGCVAPAPDDAGGTGGGPGSGAGGAGATGGSAGRGGSGSGGSGAPAVAGSGGAGGAGTGGGGGSEAVAPDAASGAVDGAAGGAPGGGTDAASSGGGSGGAGGGPAVSDPGSEGDGNVTVSGPYMPPPEATLQPGVTAGKLRPVMIVSKIFAGRDRVVQVYTPEGYVDRTPAPFMVLQDGPSYINNFKLPTVLDNMIARKQLPAVIAIFVPNGGSNRSFEYDSLTDQYVRFVLEEVLPAVERELPVKLTTDPEGRAAGGHSSGGIAAFLMGWHRPDQFHRILTHSGSFVNIRGGNKVPGMVSGEAAKPLRVFLSVGTKDNEAPRWQTGNEQMASALAGKNYHYRFVLMKDGTHSQQHPASILPETLLWLWRGYPVAGP